MILLVYIGQNSNKIEIPYRNERRSGGGSWTKLPSVFFPSHTVFLDFFDGVTVQGLSRLDWIVWLLIQNTGKQKTKNNTANKRAIVEQIYGKDHQE